MTQAASHRPLRLLAIAASAVAVLACMALPTRGAGGGFAVIVAASGLAVLLAALTSLCWHGLHHLRLVGRLRALSVPSIQAGVPVRELMGTDMPFVAGIRRPVIYCPRALSARLSHEELRAVLLHEQCHLADRAPARLLVLSAIASLAPLAAVRAWVQAERARLEIDADLYAIERGASRASLASALLKLVAQDAPVGAPAFSSSAELRLRALVGDYEPAVATRAPDLASAIAAFVFAVGCLALYIR